MGAIHTLFARGTHVNIHILGVIAKHALPTCIQVIGISVVAGVALGGIETEGTLSIWTIYFSAEIEHVECIAKLANSAMDSVGALSASCDYGAALRAIVVDGIEKI